MKNGTAHKGIMDDGTANDGLANDGIVNDGTVNDGTANDGTTNDRTANEVKDILNNILEEISHCAESLNEDQCLDLECRIRKADKIFVAGAGRSLLMIRGLAMRLMHMGFTSYVAGETVTPGIGPGDLLIIASGSGATGTLKVMAEKCKYVGADLALITTMPESPIGKLADCVVTVDAATTKSEGNTKKSIQPGANAFEQMVLLLGDALVIHLTMGEGLDRKNETLMKRHANLE